MEHFSVAVKGRDRESSNLIQIHFFPANGTCLAVSGAFVEWSRRMKVGIFIEASQLGEIPTRLESNQVSKGKAHKQLLQLQSERLDFQ